MRMRGAFRLITVGVSALAVMSCELDEVEIPRGDALVVVHAIMRPDTNQQFVLVELTFTGEEAVSEFARGSLKPYR